VWNTKFHYRAYSGPPLAPIMNLINPVHIFPHYLLIARSNIILPSTLRSSKWSLLSNECYIPHPSDRPRFDHPDSIWWRSSLYDSFLPPSLPPCPDILSILFSNTLRLCFERVHISNKFLFIGSSCYGVAFCNFRVKFISLYRNMDLNFRALFSELSEMFASRCYIINGTYLSCVWFKTCLMDSDKFSSLSRVECFLHRFYLSLFVCRVASSSFAQQRRWNWTFNLISRVVRYELFKQHSETFRNEQLLTNKIISQKIRVLSF
jgi:hypothetical protein